MRWLVALTFAVLAACGSSSATVPDAPIDGVANPCLACTADQLCVARYDGICEADIRCIAKSADCPGNVCSPACEAAYCTPSPYQCQTRSPCGGPPPPAGAFTCYGP